MISNSWNTHSCFDDVGEKTSPKFNCSSVINIIAMSSMSATSKSTTLYTTHKHKHTLSHVGCVLKFPRGDSASAVDRIRRVTTTHCFDFFACRVRSGIMSIVLFPANILLHMHPIFST